MKFYKHIITICKLEFVWKWKTNTTFWIILGKIYIFTFDIKNWNFEIYIWNKHEWKCIKYVEHDFKEEIQDEILNNEQLNILHNISNENFEWT
jgi:hypothetical protein